MWLFPHMGPACLSSLLYVQVVLTDQEHILSLTRENLALNFPATSASSSRGPQQPDTTGSIAAATSGAVASIPSGCDMQQQQQPLSAAAAFAAAFGSLTDSSQAAPASTQPPSCALDVQQVYAPGPLVVEYTWGEPLQQLQDRLASAGATRLGCGGEAGTSSPSGISSSVAQAGDPVGQLAGLGFDIVLGADLLYDVSAHPAVLHSLQQLAAASPHLQVFLCWRDRVLGEAAFLDAAAAAGWVVEQVPVSMLHPEFQTGYYKLVALTRLP